ncbi:MAG: hypothetical protein IJR85_08440 [Synergistaceae bacterium]|nr:hypothetical protein [Synergistaceae bacterium]
MRKAVVLIWLAVLCGTSWGMNYPEMGVCRGSNVKLREFPGEKGKIAGSVNTGRHLVLLGETSVDGQLWYKVGHPMRKGNVWIPASYVYKLYSGMDTEPAFVMVRMTFGITPDKTRAFMGSPLHAEARYLEYEGCKLWYDSNRNLEKAEISTEGYAVGNVEVGDEIWKLDSLGIPGHHGDSWILKSGSGEEIEFLFSDSRISGIIWSRPES